MGAALRRTDPEILLSLRGVTLAFGGVSVLSGLDFELRAGEICAIIGPNGAGKSSLINVISGVYRPSAGEIAIRGRRFAEAPAQKLAALGVARTFQNLALFRGLDVIENIEMGLAFSARANVFEQIFGLARARAEARAARAAADQAIGLLALDAYRHRPADSLPYGLQKRVELARALVARPKILLLDEPLAGMTATEKQDMVRFIRAARDQFGASVAMIEHDIGVVMELSDRVVVLDYGRKIADGPPETVRADPAVIDAYLGVPHTDQAGAGL